MLNLNFVGIFLVLGIIGRLSHKCEIVFKIIYILDESIKAYVCEDLKHVTYNGQIYSLSALADMLRGKGPSAGPQYFMYNGKELNQIREEIGF